jgi:hypothetical protein
LPRLFEPYVSLENGDISNLLSRAGFNLLTIDVDEVKVAYPSMWELLEDLSDMGEANAIMGRFGFPFNPEGLSLTFFIWQA